MSVEDKEKDLEGKFTKGRDTGHVIFAVWGTLSIKQGSVKASANKGTPL